MDYDTKIRLIVYGLIALWFAVVAAYNYGKIIEWRTNEGWFNMPIKIIEKTLKPVVLRFQFRFDSRQFSNMGCSSEHLEYLRKQAIDEAYIKFSRDLKNHISLEKKDDFMNDPLLETYELKITVYHE